MRFCATDQGRAHRPVGMATIRFLWQQEEAAVDAVVFQRTPSRDAILTQTEQWPGKEWKATAAMVLVAA